MTSDKYRRLSQAVDSQLVGRGVVAMVEVPRKFALVAAVNRRKPEDSAYSVHRARFRSDGRIEFDRSRYCLCRYTAFQMLCLRIAEQLKDESQQLAMKALIDGDMREHALQAGLYHGAACVLDKFGDEVP